MKIRMMTFHTPKNYGAVLQAYALQQFLKKEFGDVKIIDYNTVNLKNMYSLLPQGKHLRTKVKKVFLKRYIADRQKQFERFDLFSKEHFDLTENYASFEELKNKPVEADVYVTGSDQVFNPTRIDEERRAFYLDFTTGDTRCISYAASFGIKNISEKFHGEISKYLSKFSKISIREKSGVDFVKNIGFEAVEVLDPVFLLEKEDWELLCNKPTPQEPYLLYYRLFRSKGADKKVRRLAKKMGLKVVVLSNIDIKTMMNASYIFNAGPEEFLSLYKNADFVVTNAFHGVAFSIIFRKQFAFCDTNPTTAERGLSLMKKFNLNDCLLGDYDIKNIEYDEVKLNDNIEYSKKFLRDAIVG